MTLRGAVAVCLVALAGSCAHAQETSLVLEKPYKCSTQVLSGWTGLVDGVTDSDGGPGCFATVNDPKFPKYMVIDLQRPCKIKRIAVHNSANGNTRHITIAVSGTGQDFEQIREFIFPNGQAMTLNQRFGENLERRAQFVRIGVLDSWGGGLGGDHGVFLREVEVFGTPTGEAGVDAPASEPTGEALMRTRALRLFKHYALDAERELKVMTVGDSLASGGEGSWAAQAVQRLVDSRTGGSVELVTLAEEGADPTAVLIHKLDEIIEAAPDVVVLSFGTDSVSYLPGTVRRDLAELLERLSDEMTSLLVLLGPVPDNTDEEALDAVRGMATELEQAARLLGLPMVRAERALLDAGVATAFETDAGEVDVPPALSEDARRTIADAFVELLTRP